MEAKKESKGMSLWNAFVILSVALGLVLVTNIILTARIGSNLNENVEEVKEKSRPANIELAIVMDSKCKDCFDVSPVIGQIRTLSTNITRESKIEIDSPEGKQLLEKYGFDIVPAVIVTGEIEKINGEGMVRKEDAYLISEFPAPYTNASTGRIQGLVKMTVIKDQSCTKCNDLNVLIGEINQAGIKITEQNIVSGSSTEGKELISKYNMDSLPALMLSGEASSYKIIQTAWPQVGTKEADGSYVTRIQYPPYVNLSTGKIMGIVSATYLTDKSCTECYDVAKHRPIISSPQGFGIALDKEETVDISEPRGMELVSRYNITKVPTALLTREVSAYQTSRFLKQFYSVEPDGAYVFRRDELFGTYKDLSNGSIVIIKQEEQ